MEIVLLLWLLLLLLLSFVVTTNGWWLCGGREQSAQFEKKIEELEVTRDMYQLQLNDMNEKLVAIMADKVSF